MEADFSKCQTVLSERLIYVFFLFILFHTFGICHYYHSIIMIVILALKSISTFLSTDNIHFTERPIHSGCCVFFVPAVNVGHLESTPINKH